MCRYVTMGRYMQVYAGICQVLVWKYLHIHAIPAHSDIPVHTCNTYLYMHTHANSDNTSHTCNTCTYQYIHTGTYLHIPLAVKYWRDTDTFLHIHRDTYRYPITPKIPAHKCNTCTCLHYIHTVTYLHTPSTGKYWKDTDTLFLIPTDTYRYLLPPKYLFIHAIPTHACIEYTQWHTCSYVQVKKYQQDTDIFLYIPTVTYRYLPPP